MLASWGRSANTSGGPIAHAVDPRVAIVVACTLVAGLSRVLLIPRHPAGSVLLGFGVAAVIFGWLCALDRLIARRAPRTLSLAASLCFGTLFYLALCAELAYSYFYSVSENREPSLLCIGVVEGLRVLFGQLLPLRGLLWLAGLVLGAHAAALLFVRYAGARSRVIGSRLDRVLVFGTLLILITGAQSNGRIRSPFADMARELAFVAKTPELDLAHAKKLPFDARVLDKSAPDDPAQRYAFDNVLVFVMETMIIRDFESERRALPASTFLNRVASQVHRYTDYHGNNQDSRTGMLDMLQSRVIPYEAYMDSVENYRFVSKLPSLVDRFNARGYQTAYTVSHADREDVLADLAWKKVVLLPAAEVDRLRKTLLCVTVYEFEYGCEDRAVLPKIFGLLDANEKLFLFHEFIWGHDPEYNEISGRSNADYYSTYLDAVVDHLREIGKLDRTLIVLTSDHGYRGHRTLGEPYAYHLPLWFYATGFEPHEDGRLFSHIDFRDLLLHELGAAPAPREPDPFVAVVGPTSISTLAILDAQGELELIRSRGNRHFILAERWAPGHTQPNLDPASFAHFFFDEYRPYFDRLGRTVGR